MLQLRREELLAFLGRCRMPDGGFCAFRDPESGAGFSNVADTWFALSSLTRLGEENPARPEDRRWILRSLSEGESHRRSPYLAWVLGAKRLAGIPLSGEDRILLRQETSRLLSETVSPEEAPDLLRELGFLFRVRLLAGVPPDGDEKETLTLFLRDNSPVGDLPTILESADRVFLEGLLSRPSGPSGPVPEEAPYRHPVLGYVLVPGSSRSDLFILLAGLRMRRNHPDPEEADALMLRVLFCQGTGGGFAPVGGARPTLEATEAALEILSRLPEGDFPGVSGSGFLPGVGKAWDDRDSSGLPPGFGRVASSETPEGR